MQHNYYNTIDQLPIKIWFEIIKSSDYSKLVIDHVELLESAQSLEKEIEELSKDKKVNKKKLNVLKKELKSKVDFYKELADAWESMFNDWIKRFDFSDEYKENLETKIRIAELQADLIITGDRYLSTLIKVEKEVLRMNEMDMQEPVELESILWKMSKFYGFKLSSRDLTVVEYYSAINEISDGR